MHEMEIMILPEKILVLSPFDTGDFDPFPRIECVGDDTAVFQVFQLGSDEGRPLPGFDMLKFDDAVKIIVEFDHETIPDVCCCSHKMKLVLEKGCKNS